MKHSGGFSMLIFQTFLLLIKITAPMGIIIEKLKEKYLGSK